MAMSRDHGRKGALWAGDMDRIHALRLLSGHEQMEKARSKQLGQKVDRCDPIR